MPRCLAALAALLVACASSTLDTADDLAPLDLKHPKDFSAPSDLAVVDAAPDDAAVADLAAPDLATPDLATPDLATPDLTLLPDLTPVDLWGPDETPFFDHYEYVDNMCPTTPQQNGTGAVGAACTTAKDCKGFCCTCPAKPAQGFFAEACINAQCVDQATTCALVLQNNPNIGACQQQ